MTTTELISHLLDAGVRLSARGERLHVDAPRGVLTAELRGELAAQKSEVLDELGGHVVVDLTDGCGPHGVSPEDVQAWWRAAAAQDVAVAVCLCCLGPSPVTFDAHGIGWGEFCGRCGATIA